MLNFGIEALNAPIELAGVIIAILVLTPEGLSACRAAMANHMQRAVNICLGSALSTIALTVPCMLIAAGFKGMDLTLGVFGGASTLLYATLLTTLITLVCARTTMLQGNVHLMLFFSYLFFIFYPYSAAGCFKAWRKPGIRCNKSFFEFVPISIYTYCLFSSNIVMVLSSKS